MDWKKVMIEGLIIATLAIIVIIIGHIIIIQVIETQRECIISTMNSSVCYRLDGML